MNGSLLCNVKTLKFVGHGCFTMDSAGAIDISKGVKVVQDGSTVTFTGEGGGNVITFGGGSMVIGNGCSSISMGSGNSIIGNVGNGNTNIVCGGKNIRIVNGQVYINGKLVKEEGEEAAKPEEPTKSFKFQPETTSISKVSVTGSFTVKRLALLDNSQFSAELKGSGDIFLPADVKFGQLTISLSGSGDVKGAKNTVCNHASFMLAGSGDISGVHILVGGSVMLSGSGDIRVTKSGTAKVQKVCSGSGDVKVKTI